MKVYKKQHSYYCGIDLHARTIYVNILEITGKGVSLCGIKEENKNMPCNPKRFL